jgi:hypothetical protein
MSVWVPDKSSRLLILLFAGILQLAAAQELPGAPRPLWVQVYTLLSARIQLPIRRNRLAPYRRVQAAGILSHDV